MTKVKPYLVPGSTPVDASVRTVKIVCVLVSSYLGWHLLCVSELPECAALTCPPNSRCMEEALTGQLVCQCQPGYQKSGPQCLCESTWTARFGWTRLLLELENVLLFFTAKNPCLQSVCHVHASCEHTGPDQHLCTCREGYGGDGKVCVALDPCQRQDGGCSSESTRCIYDGPGKVRVLWVWSKTGSG